MEIKDRPKARSVWTVRLFSNAVLLRAFKDGRLILERGIEPDLPPLYVELLKAGDELPVKFKRMVRLTKNGVAQDRRIVRAMQLR